MSWQYFNDTGLSGGTGNLADQTFYIDSYNGNDLNDGSHVAPFKTLQKGLDAATQGGIFNDGADFILAGYFKETNFSNKRGVVSYIAEGDVVIDGALATVFEPVVTANAFRGCGFNKNRYNTIARRQYGRLTFKNYSEGVMFGHNNNGGLTLVSSIYDCTFINCNRVGGENLYNGVSTGAAYIVDAKGCVFKDIYGFVHITNRNSGSETTLCHNNTFINCTLVRFDAGADNTSTQSCYFDAATKIQLDSGQFLSTGEFNHCHIEGNLTDKITIEAATFDDNELAQVTYPDFNVDGRTSTGATEFNAISPSDYTYPNTAINATAGYLGTYIGAFGIADGAQAIADANWVADVKVDKTTVPTEATLIGTPEGIIETTNGVHIVTDSKPKILKRLTLPDELNDYELGKVIDSTKSVSGGTPSIRTVEIDFSSDSGATYHGSWVEVPINGKPKIDGAGVGNGSPLYDATTGTDIKLTHIKYRITLRNDEQPII